MITDTHPMQKSIHERRRQPWSWIFHIQETRPPLLLLPIKLDDDNSWWWLVSSVAWFLSFLLSFDSDRHFLWSHSEVKQEHRLNQINDRRESQEQNEEGVEFLWYWVVTQKPGETSWGEFSHQRNIRQIPASSELTGNIIGNRKLSTSELQVRWSNGGNS